MTSRAGQGAGGAEELDAVEANSDPVSRLPVAVRIATLSALLLLVIYTLISGSRVNRPAGIEARDAALRPNAELLAARGDAALQQLRAGVQAGAAALSADPRRPLDAAEAALRLARPAASGAAVVSGQEVLAVSGSASGAGWRAAAQSLPAGQGRAPQPPWIGQLASSKDRDGRWTYAAAGAPRAGERVSIVLAADLGSLLGGAEAGAQVLASADGTVLAARGVASDQARSLKTLGLNPADALGGDGAGRQLQANLGGAHDAPVVVAASSDKLLIAVVGAPPQVAASSQAGTAIEILFVTVPLAIGCGLALMLMRQTRKASAAQLAQAQSERKFRMAVEAARCGIWEWRLRDQVLVMSEVTGVMLGWGGSGLASTEDVIAHIAPEYRDRVRQALADAVAFGAFDVSFCVPRPSGGSSWIDARGQAFGEPDNGGYVTIIGVALDVTEERTAERRAQNAERRLHDAIDSVSEAFVLWDRRGRLLMCNQRYRDFFSLEPRVVQPGALREEVQKLAELAIHRHAPGLDPRHGAREVELIDGRWLQISERRTADGGAVMTAADITMIKRQEEARRLNEEALQHALSRLEESHRELSELAEKYQAEKLRAESANTAKGEFLANMSHELRTPLNAINGFSEMMSNEMFGPMGDRRYKDYAQDILASGQHLLTLINDILDMSKIEAGKLALHFEPVDLADLVEDAVRLMRNRAEVARLTIVVDVPTTLPEIEADYRALKQVLLNLLSNAIKFTPAGGRAEVAACVMADDQGAGRVRISVCDTGIGIAREDIGRLARPFEQIETQHSKTQQGTGLGLALTKSLIELHDGVFAMESEPGRGTTVSCILPVKRRQKARPSQSSAAQTPPAPTSFSPTPVLQIAGADEAEPPAPVQARRPAQARPTQAQLSAASPASEAETTR